MFSSPRSSLMTLLRLLQHDLSADEGLAVRQQLAASLELARQYHRLSEMLARPVPPESLLAHADNVSADTVADFIAGTMSKTEESDFVRHCLDSPSLLRELCAVVRLEDDDLSAEDIAAAAQFGAGRPRDPDREVDPDGEGIPMAASLAWPGEDQMLALVQAARLLAGDVPALPVSAEPAANPAPARNTGATQPVGSDSPWKKRGRSAAHNPRSRRASRLTLTAVALLATAALLAVLVWFPMSFRPGESSRSSQISPVADGTEERVAEGLAAGRSGQSLPHESAVDGTSPENMRDRESSVSERGPDPATVSNRQSPRDGGAAAGATDDDDAAREEARAVASPVPLPADPSTLAGLPVPPDGAESRSPTPPTVGPPADGPPADGPPAASPVALVTGWRDVDGVVGIRESDSSVWHGILSRAALSLNATDSDLRVITLGSSRVVGDLPLAAELIVDANTSLGLGRTDSGDDPPLPQYSVGYGRFALASLRRGTRFSIQAGPSPLILDVEDDDAAVGVEKSGDTLVIAVWRGRAKLDGRPLSRRQWAVVNPGGMVGDLRAPPNAVDWHRRRFADRNLPEPMTDPFNRAEDLLASAQQIAELPDTPAGTQLLAAQLRMELSVSDLQPPPEQLLQSMAGSANEAYRTWLIQWILTAMSRAPARQEQLLGALLDQMEIGNTQRVYVRQWFIAAVNGHRPTAAHLAHLSHSLQSQNHVFERQCAKYFLQQILNEPMADYDPGMTPERATLERIRLRIRAWQQLNIP